MRPSFLMLFIAAAFMFACKGKGKKNMSGDATVDMGDLIEFFDPVKLPVNYTDSVLKGKNTDSTLISHTIFNQFIGDSVLQKAYGKDKPKIYAVSRFQNEAAETYLVFKAIGTKKTLYVAAIDKDQKFKASYPLLSTDAKQSSADRVSIDGRYNFYLTETYKAPDGSVEEYSNVLAYNSAGLFMVIMVDGLKEGVQKPVINPIDTLPRKHKFSGNYGKDARNFISIRDGKTPQDFVFFLNFDRGKNSECRSELKGEAVLVSKDSAVWQGTGEPCRIGFRFTASGVRINEINNCANRRPADCSFNANYSRQKDAVKAAEKK